MHTARLRSVTDSEAGNLDWVSQHADCALSWHFGANDPGPSWVTNGPHSLASPRSAKRRIAGARTRRSIDTSAANL
jgi:hypothetical protein